MKKLTTFLLALVLVMSLTVTAFAAAGLGNFVKANVYSAGQFSDISKNSKEWYVDNVKAAYEYGLIVGNANGSFGVKDNLTIAQTLAIASRLHNIYGGGTGVFDQTKGNLWYDCYVDYCINQGIIRSGEYSNYDAQATRAQFAKILANSFPDSALPAINTVEYIPDVSEGASYYNDVIKLYRAGILTGNDSQGTFAPTKNIVRTEVAAIVTRMADTSLRKSITIKKPDNPNPPAPSTKVNPEAYKYMTNYISKSNETYTEDGIVYLPLAYAPAEKAGEYDEVYMLLFNKSENKLSIVGLRQDSTAQNPDMISAIFFDSALGTPYNAMYACSLGESVLFSGTTKVDPAAFKALVETFKFSETEGALASDTTFLKQASTILSADIAIGLYTVNELILKSSPYTLADLGFGDLGLDDL